MTKTSALIFLAIAVSLDNCSVGMTYGMKKIRIPFRSIVIIAFCSVLSLSVGMLFGYVGGQVLNDSWTGKLGGAILITLGISMTYQFFKQEKEDEASLSEKDNTVLFQWEIKSLGIVIHILKRPLSADFDQSGTITGLEAFFLGLALSLDAFGAGIGAAMLHYPVLLLGFSIMGMSTLFLYVGLKAGHLLSDTVFIKGISFIPGVVLIIIGCFKIYL